MSSEVSCRAPTCSTAQITPRLPPRRRTPSPSGESTGRRVPVGLDPRASASTISRRMLRGARAVPRSGRRARSEILRRDQVARRALRHDLGDAADVGGDHRPWPRQRLRGGQAAARAVARGRRHDEVSGGVPSGQLVRTGTLCRMITRPPKRAATLRRRRRDRADRSQQQEARLRLPLEHRRGSRRGRHAGPYRGRSGRRREPRASARRCQPERRMASPSWSGRNPRAVQPIGHDFHLRAEAERCHPEAQCRLPETNRRVAA